MEYIYCSDSKKFTNIYITVHRCSLQNVFLSQKLTTHIPHTQKMECGIHFVIFRWGNCHEYWMLFCKIHQQRMCVGCFFSSSFEPIIILTRSYCELLMSGSSLQSATRLFQSNQSMSDIYIYISNTRATFFNHDSQYEKIIFLASIHVVVRGQALLA